jgi:rare lipoprotein A
LPQIRQTARYGAVSLSPEGFNIVDSTGSDGLGLIFYAPRSFDTEAADRNIESAIAAANAMATRPGALADWRQSIDMDARAIRLELGVFDGQARVDEVLEEFALLGAVDEESVTLSGQPATRLTLTHLKPGVSRQDIVERVEALGLQRAIMY